MDDQSITIRYAAAGGKHLNVIADANRQLQIKWLSAEVELRYANILQKPRKLYAELPGPLMATC